MTSFPVLILCAAFDHLFPDSVAELCTMGGTSVSPVRAPKPSDRWGNAFQWVRIIKPAALCVAAFFPVGVDVSA